jgi:Ala-tRNA(Pro) deacylase
MNTGKIKDFHAAGLTGGGPGIDSNHEEFGFKSIRLWSQKGVIRVAIVTRLEEFLKKNKGHYKIVAHPEAYTAQEVAALIHVPGKELAKVVMVKTGDRFVMTVLPASWMVNFKKLKEALGEKDLRLATEDEFKTLFPDCEPGAEPPFGNLYDIDTVVDSSLAENEHIFFNGGNHQEAVKMDYKEYADLVKPKVFEFASQVH